MKGSIKDFFSKCDQIRWKLRIWSHLPKKSLTENFAFCAVQSWTVRRIRGTNSVQTNLKNAGKVMIVRSRDFAKTLHL